MECHFESAETCSNKGTPSWNVHKLRGPMKLWLCLKENIVHLWFYSRFELFWPKCIFNHTGSAICSESLGDGGFLSQFFPWNTHRHDVKNQKRWGTCPPPSHLVAESMLNHLQCVGVKTQNKKHDFSKTTSNVQKVKSQMPTSDTNTPHNYLISMIVDFK